MALRSLYPLFFLLGMLMLGACSVKDESLRTDSRRAEKKYNTAKEAYEKRGGMGSGRQRGRGGRRRGSKRKQKDDWRKTVRKELKKALKIDPDFLNAHRLLAEFHGEMGETKKALEHYRRLVEEDPTFYPEALLVLASQDMSKGAYAKAEKKLEKYGGMAGRGEGLGGRAQLMLESARFAQKAKEDPVPFEPKNLGKGVNSEYPEYFPCLTVDQQTLLFTRRIRDRKHPRGSHEDFFSSVKREGEWQKAKNLKAPINTMYNEGAPTLAPNGDLLIFTACAALGGYGPGRKGKGSCDLFATKKVGGEWLQPQNLGGPINTRNWESQPSMAPDGKTLYFVRGKITTKGVKEQDIYKSELKEDGKWSEPKKLSSTINTPYKEESVFIHPDGRTLYFSSNGHPGMGGLDIFYSKKQADGSWSEPQNLGYPINTHQQENSLLVSPDGKHAYFGSDREGGYGGLDLYRFQLPEDVQADPVTYMKGKVVDAETGEPLEAEFRLKELRSGDLITRSRSDAKNGSFLVPLPIGRKYALSVDKKGYMFHSEHFVLDEKGTRGDPVKKNVALQPIDTGKSVVLENVFFETAKYDLKKESRVELDKLYRFLNENPSLRIEIQGHTDSVGTSRDNQVLSENRAKAVYDYLKKKGIDPDRMEAKGYGERRPIADNSTPEGRARNRRTAYEIIGK